MNAWFPVCYSKLIIQGVNNMSGRLNIFYKIYDRATKLGAKVLDTNIYFNTYSVTCYLILQEDGDGVRK